MSNTCKNIKDLFELINLLQKDQSILDTLDKISDVITNAYKNGNKTIFCGNGGSSAEAQHLAAELSGKFNLNRKAIPSEACHVNSSFVTAVSNDYDFTKVYARYLEAFGEENDILVGLSTSGTSPNVIEAFKLARQKNMITVAMTGKSGGDLNALSDFIVKVPSEIVPRIQEIHLLWGHIICENVEKELFGHEE